MDLAALQAAGLYDPDDPDEGERRALLDYLVGLGCSVEEMQRAHARGRLFALAGDRLIRPGAGTLTLAEVAGAAGLDLGVVRRGWRAFGLPDSGPDVAICSPGDVELMQLYAGAIGMLGEDVNLQMARVIGSVMSRLAEAASAAARAGVPALTLAHADSELETAQEFARVAAVAPVLVRMCDAVFRYHLESVREMFEASESDDVVGQRGARLGVGFADLSGFTAMSQSLPTAELAYFLTAFEDAATQTVSAHGGRIVKFIGDAVMFVAPRPEQVAGIAVSLVDHPAAAQAGLSVRAGLEYGALLAQDGDYFGPPVNLASRLVALAEPGEVLCSTGLVERLDPAGWSARAREPLAVRGWSEPVTVYDLARAASA